MALKRISIPSTFTKDGITKTATAEFALGLGPCGKEVTLLDLQVRGSFATVTQQTADMETKTFSYPVHLLVGRIEAVELATAT